MFVCWLTALARFKVGIDFGVRVAGESKLTSKVIINYVQHLRELYTFKFPWLLPALVVVAVVVFFLVFKRFLL